MVEPLPRQPPVSAFSINHKPEGWMYCCTGWLLFVCLLAHTRVCVFIHVRQGERNTTRRWELNPYRKSEVVLRDEVFRDMTVAK